MFCLALKRIKRRIHPETALWVLKGCTIPAPSGIKLRTLYRNASNNGDWIETGTYLAETTVALSRKFKNRKIFTIEPAQELFTFVSKRYSKISNVTFIFGTSEDRLSNTIERIETEEINFWLDGHYSGDVTFKGEIESPIIFELDQIEKRIRLFTEATIFIDDFRLFGEAQGYPKKEFLIDWAKKNILTWNVENDIFIMKTIKISNPSECIQNLKAYDPEAGGTH